MKTTRIFLLVISVMAIILQPVANAETFGERLEKLKKTEAPILLYGKVVDQFGEPVKNAIVQYCTEKYGLLKPVYGYGKTTSDDDGQFEISYGKACVLYIDDIVIYGYEFQRSSNGNVSRFDFRSSRRDRHRPDKSNPVAFHLRKKLASGTYLLKKEFKIVLEADAEELYWVRDFDKGWDSNPRSQKDPKVFWDIEVSGMLDLKKKEWRLTFKTNGEHSGIQIRDEFLYEAPADGYAKSLDAVFPFSERGKFPVRYLYVRLREPGMYARFKISNYSSADEKKLYVRCEGVINPYGDRSFEELECNDKHEDYVRFGRCDTEADDAFRHQRLAPRPPFEEWVKKGQARY